MTGIYLHIPFCLHKCFYCDFYSVTDTSLMNSYISAMENQILGCMPREIDSIYFGGGTPSLLGGEQIERVLNSLRKVFKINDNCEITVEVNPASCDLLTLQKYKAAGINRVSIGVQTANDRTLKVLGRGHSYLDSKKILEEVIKAGFSNISADLMLALPDEDEEDVLKTIRLVKEGGATHISAYLLKLSEGTVLYKNQTKGLPDEDRAADIYMYTAEKLESYGYMQYEISNFSMPFFESRHNEKYWNCEEYIGIGAGAHSSINGKRYHFKTDIYEYNKCFYIPSTNFINGLEFDGDVLWDDYFILRLRTNKGLSLDVLIDRFDKELNTKTEDLLNIYEKECLLEYKENTIRLTRKGMLLSNEIFSSLLIAMESE